MASIIHRVLHSLFPSLWPLESVQREPEVLFVSPPKRQKLSGTLHGNNTLREINPSGGTSQVQGRYFTGLSAKCLQVETPNQLNNCFQSERQQKYSTGRIQGETICLDDDEDEENTAPVKDSPQTLNQRKRKLSVRPVESIDLTSDTESAPIGATCNYVDLTEDSDKEDHYTTSQPRYGAIDLTRESSQSTEGRRHHVLPGSRRLSVSNSFHLRMRRSNSSSSSLIRRGGIARHSAPLESVNLEEKKKFGFLLGTFMNETQVTFNPNPSFRKQPLDSSNVIVLDDDEPSAGRSRREETTRDGLERGRAQEEGTTSSTSQGAALSQVDASVSVAQPRETTAASTNTNKGVKQEIARVNSFEKKIKDVPYAQDNFTADVLEKYVKLSKDFEATRDRFVREAKMCSAVTRKLVDDQMTERLERHLRLTEAVIPEPEPPKPQFISVIKPLPQLTPDMLKKVNSAYKGNKEDILISKYNYNIKRRDIVTLAGTTWLNDEVINFYMVLIEKRNKDSESYPNVHTFSSFFYTGLLQRGIENMKRWTKKFNIFEKELILIPIHLQIHWCLVVIDMKKKEVNFYDSMGNPNNRCLNAMTNFLKVEHLNKQGSELDMSQWKVSNVQGIPQQMNGSDCGVFACTFAEFSSRRAPFSFDQSKMQYFRQKMTYEILTGQLL